MEENIPKLRNQIARARKLADWMQENLDMTVAEFEEARAKAPDVDYWTVIGLAAQVHEPSEVTRELTLAFMADREARKRRRSKV